MLSRFESPEEKEEERESVRFAEDKEGGLRKRALASAEQLRRSVSQRIPTEVKHGGYVDSYNSILK